MLCIRFCIGSYLKCVLHGRVTYAKTETLNHGKHRARPGIRYLSKIRRIYFDKEYGEVFAKSNKKAAERLGLVIKKARPKQKKPNNQRRRLPRYTSRWAPILVQSHSLVLSRKQYNMIFKRVTLGYRCILVRNSLTKLTTVFTVSLTIFQVKTKIPLDSVA